MYRVAGTIMIAAVGCSPVVADEVLSGTVAGKSITITADTDRFAGAIASIVWNGKEFIDSVDHGREFQSASNHGILGIPYCAEGYNPTEAGSRDDGAGPTSSSVLNSISVIGDTLSTESQLAFWMKPGQSNPLGCNAYSTGTLSDVSLSKQVSLGALGINNLIRHDVTFDVPSSVDFTFHQFEALTGYMPAEFSVFRTWNPVTGALAPLSDGPGEQPLPVVLSTPDDQFAMGIFAFGLPQNTNPDAGFGRFRFPTANSSGPGDGVVKWNAAYRYGSPDSTAVIPETSFSFTQYVAIGTLQDVTDAFSALPAANASITNTSGDVIVIPPPTSVALGGMVGNVVVFQEQQNFDLPVSVDVDTTEPGTYDQVADAIADNLSADTTVNSYLFHFNAANPPDVFTSTFSSITFEHEILGVAFLKDTLNAGHPILGSPTTTYSDNIGQLNLVPGSDGADVFTISPDRRTISFDLSTRAADNARIITAVPEPSSFVLSALAGLILALASRHRI